ncbi:MAG: MFS transporter [Parachlamydiales bacterium]|nr:MFS transporter [Parachlamydiales bacterium]
MSTLATKNEEKYLKLTKWPLLGAIFFSEPFLFIAYNLLPFLLQEKLHASAFQISLLITLRPVVSLFSFYWSANLTQKQHELRANLITAEILSTLPFLLFFFFDNIWYMLFSAGMYTLFYRAGTPALMEILRINLPKVLREKFFSHRLIIGYLEGIFISSIIGFFLDRKLFHHHGWKILLLGSALLRILGILLQKKIPVKGFPQNDKITFEKKLSWSNILVPWKEGIALLKRRKDFARFQWGFMASGFGIMFILPAIPLFKKYAHLSYLDLALSLALFKGTGFVLFSPLWRRGLNRLPLPLLSSIVFFIAGIFPFCLSLSYYYTSAFFLAYFLYGIAQGGSSLVWHLSGPIFAAEEESSQYSRINVLVIAVRGMIAPLLGGFLCDRINPLFVFILGSLFCLSGSVIMLMPYIQKLREKNSST